MTEQIYEFNAIVQKEIYYSEKTCYGIYLFVTYENLPNLDTVGMPNKKNNIAYCGTLVGSCQRLEPSQEYQVKAILVEDKRYGWQYKFINVSRDIPKTEDDTRNYLSSILSESHTNVLLQQYPNIVNNIIEDASFEPDYEQLPGIKEKTFAKIKLKILETYVISDILALLSPLGVTFTMIKRISEKEKNVSLLKQKLIDNPYQLIGFVPRLTFIKVDMFALKLNPSLLKSETRVYSAIEYILEKTGEDDGNTVIPTETLYNKVRGLIPQAIETYHTIIEREKEVTEKNEIKRLYINDEYCGLGMYYHMEKYIYEKLVSLAENEYIFGIKNYDEIIERTNKELGFKLSDEQNDIIKKIDIKNVILISGKAGVGKTTVVKSIVNAFKDYKINIAALSAKAARRATEVTNHPASTIHKLLEYDGSKFNRDAHNTLDCNILIVDEASMVNTYLFYSLLKAVPKDCKVVIVGDFLQLPPIGAGAIFSDLLKTKNKNFVYINLNTVYRQAQESGIVMDANRIREGKIPFDGISASVVSGVKKDMRYIFNENIEAIQEIIVKLFVGYVEKGVPIEDISAIVPRKDSVLNSTKFINERILDILIPQTPNNHVKIGNSEFRVGCRVINTTNMYRIFTVKNAETDVLNGELGTVIAVNPDAQKKQIVVDFGDKVICFEKDEIFNLELGYCLTIHKKQGDQSKIVILGFDKTHSIMLSSNSIYTGITRAEDVCYVIAQYNPFIRGVKNKLEQNRVTFLNHILNKQNEENI